MEAAKIVPLYTEKRCSCSRQGVYSRWKRRIRILRYVGVRLEVRPHIITGSTTSIQNLVKSVARAGLAVDDIVLEPLASSEAVLTKDEKELGVVLVDIGGGTTDLVVFQEGISVIQLSCLSEETTSVMILL